MTGAPSDDDLHDVDFITMPVCICDFRDRISVVHRAPTDPRKCRFGTVFPEVPGWCGKEETR